MPKVSIILPTYNGSKWISGAIKSVLTQSFLDWELIIIDDGSTDNTAEIVNKFSHKDARIIYLRNKENLGLAKTLNRGLGEARAEIIARLDEDDEWMCADKLEVQMDFMQRNPQCVLVGTNIVAVDEVGAEVGRYMFPEDDLAIRSKMLDVNCFAHSSVAFRKSVAIGVGGYSTTISPLEDYDLWLKLGMSGKLANMGRYCVKYLIRRNSLSRKSKKIEQALLAIKLIKQYKKAYPHFWKYITLRYFGLFKYWLLSLMPFSFRVFLTRLKYKIKGWRK